MLIRSSVSSMRSFRNCSLDCRNSTLVTYTSSRASASCTSACPVRFFRGATGKPLACCRPPPCAWGASPALPGIFLRPEYAFRLRTRTILAEVLRGRAASLGGRTRPPASSLATEALLGARAMLLAWNLVDVRCGTGALPTRLFSDLLFRMLALMSCSFRVLRLVGLRWVPRCMEDTVVRPGCPSPGSGWAAPLAFATATPLLACSTGCPSTITPSPAPSAKCASAPASRGECRA
mmetsp:Transcript_2287/g.5721  ORF Transcript_2287/g.5721 Transcript_2287/m.5721 type:complete len:235 (+) Transcript_2287:406-1110(+)